MHLPGVSIALSYVLPRSSHDITPLPALQMSKKKRFKVLFHLTVKFLVTFLFVPFVCWFSFHVYVDTSANGKWSLADTPMHVRTRATTQYTPM
eukprot:SAG25_NODE_1535_length_2830_cov_1.404980_2_plen_93_part_00